MADTMTLPAIGSVKSEYVWAGGALVVGIAGYAWWHARGSKSGSSPTYTLNPSDVIPATDFNNPAPNSNNPVSVDSTGGAITTNSQWTQKATEYLASIGWDPKLISSALGKYLNRQGLSPDEITAVQTAIGVEGYPPQGGPYAITPATGDTGTKNPPGVKFVKFTTDGTTSLNEYAHRFNTQPSQIWWATQSNEQTPQALNDYENAGRFDTPPPRGLDMYYPEPG